MLLSDEAASVEVNTQVYCAGGKVAIGNRNIAAFRQQYSNKYIMSHNSASLDRKTKSLSLPDSQGIFCPIVAQLCKQFVTV